MNIDERKNKNVFDFFSITYDFSNFDFSFIKNKSTKED